MAHSGLKRWIKPLKRSEKSRVRKYIEKRRKESETFHQLQGNRWKLTWEQIKEIF